MKCLCKAFDCYMFTQALGLFLLDIREPRAFLHCMSLTCWQKCLFLLEQELRLKIMPRLMIYAGSQVEHLSHNCF